VRRVVTGHDEKGRAVVLFDSKAGNVASQRPKQERCLLWTTDTLPASNEGSEDRGALNVGIGMPNSTVFGIVKLDPGVAERAHRTATIDYGIILSGHLGLKLDVGEVMLHPGDIFVQRGTMHTWFNNGTEPAVICVAMVAAEPVMAGGTPLGNHL
jgi:hypothetical protein